jgi:2,3-bisphosphoglycerate-dependent phosphoglycerate mutase
MATDPRALWLLRHGQSLGNVVRDAAAGQEVETLDIVERDMDVPLSELGRQQATAFGTWLAGQPEQPDVVLSSPYVRAVETADLLVKAAGLGLPVHLDERLRERELGILDLLTRRGVEARYPDEARRKERLGKFYHRPPGGESWVDVALRIRSLRDSLGREHLDKRVLMVCHEVVVVIWRYLIEDLNEASALALSRDHPLANCALTTYVTGADERLTLELEGWTAPLEMEAVPVTEEHDARVKPR